MNDILKIKLTFFTRHRNLSRNRISGLSRTFRFDDPDYVYLLELRRSFALLLPSPSYLKNPKVLRRCMRHYHYLFFYWKSTTRGYQKVSGLYLLLKEKWWWMNFARSIDELCSLTSHASRNVGVQSLEGIKRTLFFWLACAGLRLHFIVLFTCLGLQVGTTRKHQILR